MIPRTAWLQLAAAVLLLGASWPVTKVALLSGATPSWFAFGRAALSALIVTVVLGLGGRLQRPGRADLPALLSLGLLQLAGFFAFAHAAVAYVPAGRTAILSNTTLLWTVPITLLLTGERIPPARWVATAISAAGVALLVGPWAVDWTDRRALVGNAFLLCASLCWAVTMAIVRRWPPRLSMFALLPWAFALAAAALLPFALAYPVGQWSGSALACIGAIGLLMAPVGTWCVMQATTALPLVVASVGFLAGPAVGLLLSAAWLDEPMTGSLLGGALLLLGGAVVATRSGR